MLESTYARPKVSGKNCTDSFASLREGTLDLVSFCILGVIAKGFFSGA